MINDPHQATAIELTLARRAIDKQAARIAELEAALKPFAKLAYKSSRALDVEYCERYGVTDDTQTTYGEGDEIITFGDLRRAARLLDGDK